MEISQDFGFRPIVFIRFNPDSYISKNNINITSCWGTTNLGIHTIKISKQKEWVNRLKCLYKQIDYWINNIPNKTVNYNYLFYDNSI